MKRLAGLGLIIGLLSLPIPAQAQVFTAEIPADFALTMIWFRVWAVTGEDLGDINLQMIPAWRKYLANRPDRYSFSNACWEVKNRAAKWTQMSRVERELWQNIWASSLPNDLALIEPVFPDAALQLRATLQTRAAQQNAAPTTPLNSQEAIMEIQRRMQNMQQLNDFNRNFYGR